MKIVKDKVYISEDKLTTKDDKGNVKTLYRFPEPLPIEVTHVDGKFYIPVTYVDPEVGDITFNESYASVLPAGLSEEDLVSACKSGIRLAIGDLAKSAYRVEGNGGNKTLVLAQQWVATSPHLMEWAGKVKAGDKDTSEWLLKLYNAR